MLPEESFCQAVKVVSDGTKRLLETENLTWNYEEKNKNHNTVKLLFVV